MTKFGASIYLSLATKEKLVEYIELLAKYNINLIFIVLEGTNKEFLEKLEEVTKTAIKHNISVFCEVDGRFFKDLNLEYKSAKKLVTWFKDKGISGIRCNKGVSLEVQAKLTNSNFKVMINGSYNIINLEQLVLEHRISSNNTISCFNFYSQRYTGSSVDFYLLNQYESHINNIDFAGFVGSSFFSVSLEIHRDWHLIEQIHHLIALGTDIIIISNHFLKEEELLMISNIEQLKVCLAIDLEKDISEEEKIILLDENIHFVRPDLSQDVIRSSQSRKFYQNFTIESRKNTSEYLEVGDVVILNKAAQKYSSELQIITKRIKNDKIRNLVARIKEPHLNYFLSELKSTRQFKFIV